jgi:hypothetical protein
VAARKGGGMGEEVEVPVLDGTNKRNGEFCGVSTGLFAAFFFSFGVEGCPRDQGAWWGRSVLPGFVPFLCTFEHILIRRFSSPESVHGAMLLIFCFL